MASGTIERPPSAFGFGTSGIELTSANDLNDITTSGHYYWSGSKPSHIPVDVSHCGLDVSSDGVNMMQRVFRGTYGNPAYPFEYVRYKYSTSAWTDWERVVPGYATYSGSTIGITGIAEGRVIGGIALLRFYDFKPTSASYNLGTLPAGLKPAVNSYGVLMSADGTNSIRAEVQTTGSVSIVHGDTGKYHYGTVVYPVV